MLGLSKHFFIFTYIIAFLLGVILLTVNQIAISKTQDLRYRKLQYFNWAFFLHIAINFIYFYGLYFAFRWEVKTTILFAVNASYIVFICLAMGALQEFSEIRIPKSVPLLLLSGSAYVVIYSLSVEESIPPSHVGAWNLPTISLLSSDTLFLVVTAISFLKLLRRVRHSATVKKEKQPLLSVFCGTILAYMLFNLYVDVSFCFTYQKSYLWDINIYNFTVLFYLLINLIAIFLFYRGQAALAISGTIASSADKYHLTEREREVLALICEGKSNPEISRILCISNYTVKRHANNLFRKMQVKSRFELVSQIKKQ